MSAAATLPRAPRAASVAGAVAVCVAAVGAATLLHAVDPTQPGHYPACPTYALTGWYCPGCGALRAVHYLTCGEVGSAWAMNPLVVLAVPYLLWAWSSWLYRGAIGARRRWAAPGWWLVTLAVGITLFGVLRNVPGLEFLAPH